MLRSGFLATWWWRTVVDSSKLCWYYYRLLNIMLAFEMLNLPTCWPTSTLNRRFARVTNSYFFVNTFGEVHPCIRLRHGCMKRGFIKLHRIYSMQSCNTRTLHGIAAQKQCKFSQRRRVSFWLSLSLDAVTSKLKQRLCIRRVPYATTRSIGFSRVCKTVENTYLKLSLHVSDAFRSYLNDSI